MIVPENVTRGVEYLDGEVPGWEECISLDRLDLGNCGDCILGQLFGDYDRAADQRKLTWRDCQRLGFTHAAGQTWRTLTAAWAAVIAARRVA